MSSMSSDPASTPPSTSPSRLGRGLAGLVGLTQFGPTEEELVANHIDGASPEEHTVVSEELVESGDEVLIPNPSWPNFTMMAALRSATVRGYRVSADNGYLPDVNELEALTNPATKLLLINTPLNPVGSVIPRERMEAVLDFAAAHDLWVVSDETLIGSLTAAFDDMEALYITDGHHRSASASRVAAT